MSPPKKLSSLPPGIIVLIGSKLSPKSRMGLAATSRKHYETLLPYLEPNPLKRKRVSGLRKSPGPAKKKQKK